MTSQTLTTSGRQMPQIDYCEVVAHLRVGFFVTTEEGTILAHNASCATLLGFAAGESLAGRSTFEFWQRSEDRLAFLDRIRQEGSVDSLPIATRNRQGQALIFELSARRVAGQGGAAAHIEGVFCDITANRQAVQALHSNQEQLERFAGQLQQFTHYLQAAREEERAAIAREIHDEFGQALTALKMDLAWFARRLPADAPDLSARLAEMLGVVDEAVQTVRRIATQLRPGLLDDLGLVAAIEWQAQEFARRSGVQCTLRLGEKDLALPSDVATALFRILQEALTNINRHAAAQHVTVELAERPGSLLLIVADDGRGISPEQIADPKALGLVGMRERARCLGGEVSIAGWPGQGTTVTAQIPRPPESEAGKDAQGSER